MNVKLKVQTIFLYMSELSYIQIERRPDTGPLDICRYPEAQQSLNQTVT